MSIWKSFDSSTVTSIIFLERLRSIKTNVQTNLSKKPYPVTCFFASPFLSLLIYKEKKGKRTPLSACSCCLINWQLSQPQFFFALLQFHFQRKKPWWILSLWIVAPLQIKWGFCLYQRAGSTSLIRLSVLWESADTLPKSTQQCSVTQ